MNQIQNSYINFAGKGLDPVTHCPNEVIFLIFSYLNPNELGRICLVSKRWRQLASDPTLLNAIDLRFFFPSLRVFNELDWKTHVDLSSFGLNVEDIPTLDKRQAIPILKRHLSSLSIEGNAGVTLLTIPQGLTLKKVAKIAESSKFGNTTRFRCIWNHFSNEVWNTPVAKTYRIVITNNILEASRNSSSSSQKELLEKFRCRIPSALELATLLVVTYMSSGKRLYNDNPWTYSLCGEQVANNYHLLIGNFTSEGIHITGDIFKLTIDTVIDKDHYDGNTHLGAGGVLNF